MAWYEIVYVNLNMTINQNMYMHSSTINIEATVGIVKKLNL